MKKWANFTGSYCPSMCFKLLLILESQQTQYISPSYYILIWYKFTKYFNNNGDSTVTACWQPPPSFKFQENLLLHNSNNVSALQLTTISNHPQQTPRVSIRKVQQYNTQTNNSKTSQILMNDARARCIESVYGRLVLCNGFSTVEATRRSVKCRER